MKSKRALIIGNFLTEGICAERGLPDRNPAGSNRMKRLGKALMAGGYDVSILSCAVSFNIKTCAKIFHRSKKEELDGLCIHFGPALAIRMLASFFEPVAYVWTLIRLVSHSRPDVILYYNYSPMLIPALLTSKYLFRVPHVQDIEDVAKPMLADWKNESEARPLQQLFYAISMSVFIRLGQCIIVPTSRFLERLPPNKDVLVLSGCLSQEDFYSSGNPSSGMKPSLNVLFSGKIQREHGVDVFLEAARLLEERQPSRFTFHLCGRGPYSGSVEKYIQEHCLGNVRFHGFVTDEAYLKLLANADIACALQDPNGRFSNCKTPSKGYEYMASGKLLCVTDIGDFERLPENTRILLKEFSGEALADQLGSLADKDIKEMRTNSLRYAREEFSVTKQGARLRHLIEGECCEID